MLYQALDINELARIKWHYFHKRFRSPFYMFLLLEGLVKHYNNKISFPYEFASFLCLDQQLATDEPSWQRIGRQLLTELTKDPKFLINLIRAMQLDNLAIETYCQHLEKIDYNQISKDELNDKFQQYLAMNYRFSGTINIPLTIENYLEQQLQETVTKKYPNNSEPVFQALTAPIKPSAIQEEATDLLQIAIKDSRDEEIVAEIKKHQEKFSWLKNNAFTGDFSSQKEITDQVNRLTNDDPAKKYADYHEEIARQQQSFNNYRQEFISDPAALNLIDTLQEAIYFRSWRTERFYRNAFYLQPFFQKLASLINLTDEKDIFYLTPPEIISLINKPATLNQAEIDRRQSAYLMFADSNGTRIFSGQIVIKAKQQIYLEPVIDTKIISGQTAYPGDVSGKVRLVLNKQQLSKIKNGDILVTTSTTPDYVPVLSKVKAIITDEGGILSHASVISRELHIPCIIGTKIATKLLKDGDIVEVDTSKGIIKIIERGK